MDVKRALAGQYHAAMDALKGAIKGCPKELWADRKKSAPYWQVVYHTLFCTHLYLSDNDKVFVPWENHQHDIQFMRVKPDREEKSYVVYAREEMLAYWAFVDRHVDERLEAMDIAAPKCGFFWYEPMTKLEHQINNIRHIQHHAAALAMRLRIHGSRGVGWVGARRVKKGKSAAGKRKGRDAG
jgi:hypothetical protein